MMKLEIINNRKEVLFSDLQIGALFVFHASSAYVFKKESEVIARNFTEDANTISITRRIEVYRVKIKSMVVEILS